MADKNALGMIGLMLGAATMFVVGVGAVVVTDHISGRLQLADSTALVTASAKLQPAKIH